MNINNTKTIKPKTFFNGHVQMKVESTIMMNDKNLTDWFGDDIPAIRQEFETMKRKGRIWLHTEGCDNYDKQSGRCLGH